MADFLDNNRIKTSFVFSDYFFENNKSVSDIVKFSISDDNIDYSVNKEQIKGTVEFSPIQSDKLFYKIFSDNTNLNEISYVVRSNGVISTVDDNITVIDGSYIEFEFKRETEFFIEFFNVGIFKNLKIDDIFVDNLEKSYIYIKKKVRIYFSNTVMNSVVNIFSVKRELSKSLHISYSFTGKSIAPETESNTDEVIKHEDDNKELQEITTITGIVVDDTQKYRIIE